MKRIALLIVIVLLAAIVIKGNFYCGGDTEFDHIKLINQKSYGGILAKYKA